MSALPDFAAAAANYTPEPETLADKTILVTGASRGFGRAIAFALAAAGATPLLLARDSHALEQIADDIEQRYGIETLLLPVNLEGASVADFDNIATLIGARCSALDGAILNAGALGMLAPISEYEPMTWARVFQVNVHSQFLLLRTILPLLERAETASIVLVSSSVGRRGRAYWGAYTASKFALEGMMQTLADELSDSSIRVNSLNPGAMRTQMRAQAYPAEDPTTLASPADIAPAVVYLVSAAGRRWHGQQLDAQLPRSAADRGRQT